MSADNNRLTPPMFPAMPHPAASNPRATDDKAWDFGTEEAYLRDGIPDVDGTNGSSRILNPGAHNLAKAKPIRPSVNLPLQVLRSVSRAVAWRRLCVAHPGVLNVSVAFTKEDSAEAASETLLPDRPISSHPNLVTMAGLKALERKLQQAQEAYELAQKIEDVNERRRQGAIPLRDARYFAARVRTAQVMADPESVDAVAFGSTVTFSRADGRVQTFRIVGEDEADPAAGTISFVSPVARSLIGKSVGDAVMTAGQEIEITSIA